MGLADFLLRLASSLDHPHILSLGPEIAPGLGLVFLNLGSWRWDSMICNGCFHFKVTLNCYHLTHEKTVLTSLVTVLLMLQGIIETFLFLFSFR
jgi:hypothetical protein